jgi:hypothetical protein
MGASVGEQQMIVIGGAPGLDHVGGERIGNRDVLEGRLGSGPLGRVAEALGLRRFLRRPSCELVNAAADGIFSSDAHRQLAGRISKNRPIDIDSL